MKNIIIAVVFLFFADIAWSYNLGLKDGSFLDVDESYAEWRKYDTWKNPMTPNKNDWDWTTEWHTTVSLWKYLYWSTNFHMSMDRSQIRYGGLEYFMGLKITPYIHVIKYHHSEHCFDIYCGRFEVEDSYGVRVYFKNMNSK